MNLPPRSAAAPSISCGTCLLILITLMMLPRYAAAADSGTPLPRTDTSSTATAEAGRDTLEHAREWIDALLEGGIREVAGDAWPTELDFEATDAGASAESQHTGTAGVPRGTAAGFSSSSASVASNELAISTAANSGNRILKTIEEQFPLMVFGVVCAAGICAVSWLTKP